jgi:multiple sugar transport system permease protein
MTTRKAVVPQSIQSTLKRWATYVVALAIAVFVSTPIYIMVAIAFQPSSALFSGGSVSLIPSTLSIENFQSLIENTNSLQFFINSIIVSVSTTVLSTGIAIAGGYALTRFELRGKRRISQVVLFSYMFSPIVLAIPLYVLFQRLGVLNRYFSITIALVAISAPFSIWLMWQFFQTMPERLEESGWTRGAGRLRVIWDIVLPIARPGYISAAIFAFAVAWNDFTMSRVLLTEESMYTINVGASLFLGQASIGWGERMATSVLICIPPFLIALFLQKYLIRGFNMGGLE